MTPGGRDRLWSRAPDGHNDKRPTGHSIQRTTRHRGVKVAATNCPASKAHRDSTSNGIVGTGLGWSRGNGVLGFRVKIGR